MITLTSEYFPFFGNLEVFYNRTITFLDVYMNFLTFIFYLSTSNLDAVVLRIHVDGLSIYPLESWVLAERGSEIKLT